MSNSGLCPKCHNYTDQAPHEYGCILGRVHQERSAVANWLRSEGIDVGTVVLNKVTLAAGNRVYWDEMQRDPHGGFTVKRGLVVTKRRWRKYDNAPPAECGLT
jgi:hypothetical protein